MSVSNISSASFEFFPPANQEQYHNLAVKIAQVGEYPMC